MSFSENDPKEIPVEDLYGFINDFPALLWRIEIHKARIEFFNNNIDVAPGIDGSLLLKNASYRSQALLADDIHLFEAFMESVKEGKTAATVFRVKNGEGRISWLKMTGALNRIDPAYYYGYLLNTDDTVRVIKSVLDTDLELKLMIEDAGNPVLLIDHEAATLVCANPAANKVFGLAETDYTNLSLESLNGDMTLLPMSNVLRELPLTRKWQGRLTFLSKDGKTRIKADTIFRYLVHQQRNLVRISLQHPAVSKAAGADTASSPSTDIKTLENTLEGRTDIIRSMEICLESPLAAGKYEGMIFSDVYIRRNKVEVYGAGSVFSALPRPESYSYKGTIAEDICRYGLDYLVVDDTEDSIKPIDWALFVPSGVRSYFAMPFYSRSVLRTVLILCATSPGRFSGSTPSEFSAMLNIVNNAVKNWRRAGRS